MVIIAVRAPVIQRRGLVRSVACYAPATPADKSAFKVTFKDVSRHLTRAQLEKAPQSMLTKLMSQVGQTCSGTEAAQELAVPCEGAGHSSAGWLDGNEDVFHVCMDCYTGGVHPDRSHDTLYSAKELKPAMVDFFQIPPELWPMGFAVSMDAWHHERELHASRIQAAHDLLPACAQEMRQRFAEPVSPNEDDRAASEWFTFHYSSSILAPIAGAERYGGNVSKYPVQLSSGLRYALLDVGQEHQMQLTFEGREDAQRGWPYGRLRWHAMKVVFKT